MIIVFIVIGLALLIFLVFYINNKRKVNAMLYEFKHCNVIVAGKKGRGKDLLFQYVIKKRKKEDYYSNIDYGYKRNKVQLKDMKIGDNTYEDFIQNKIVKAPHKFKEKTDFYISDGGIYLPSYMDSKLYREFAGLPIFYALSRHLYNSNVHVNVQNFGRLWKALREQADYYVYVKKTMHLPFILITSVYTYDKYQSAEQNLKPLKSRLMNKFSHAEKDKYDAQNGEISHFFIWQFTKSIHYDTRAFERICLKGKRKK